MTVTIELSEENAEVLRKQADAQGLTLEAWVLELANRNALMESDPLERKLTTEEAIAGLREFHKHVKPDPEGWTAVDYVRHGRR
jgi:hypothetical protein